jgi:lipopolysaccharide biosynthesis glycosyltransferase
MASCCIVFTTDAKYLFPTLVAAIGARKHSPAEKADVCIYCFDAHEAAKRAFAPVCERESIELTFLNSSIIEGANPMMARLFLTRFVPSRCTDVLYLDGDILVTGSLAPLIDAQVPPDHFLAANDPFTFLLDDDTRQSRDLQSYLQHAGFTLDQARSYFNSGVLRMNKNGWEQIGSDAWNYFSRNPSKSRFPDQDAINFTGMDKRLPLSFCWNYPAFFRNARVEDRIAPKIHHFMSMPKPWHGQFAPWKARFGNIYASSLERYPQILPFAISMPRHQRWKYTLQQRAKQISETMTWGLSRRRDRILAYERACIPLSKSSALSPLSQPSIL